MEKPCHIKVHKCLGVSALSLQLLLLCMYIYILLEVPKSIRKITDINLQWISDYLLTFIPQLSTQIVIVVS